MVSRRQEARPLVRSFPLVTVFREGMEVVHTRRVIVRVVVQPWPVVQLWTRGPSEQPGPSIKAGCGSEMQEQQRHNPKSVGLVTRSLEGLCLNPHIFLLLLLISSVEVAICG
jgi:hypothetical protein